MDDKSKEMLIEAIKEGFKELRSLNAGTDEHSKQTSDIVRLYDIKLKEEKFEDERSENTYKRGVESEKLELERAFKEAEMKQNFKSTVLMVGKEVAVVGLMLLGNGIGMTRIMRFETTGTIGTKAFGLLPKILPKKF